MSASAPKDAVEEVSNAAKLGTLESQLATIDESEFTDLNRVLMGGVFDTLNSLAHILLALLYAYFVGYFGFHISWALLAIGLVWFLDRQYKEHGWKRRFSLFLRDEQKRRVVAAEKESVEWLNLALRKFFPIYSPQITDIVEGSIIAAVEAAMAVPPSPVTGVEVQGVDLGVNPPQLSMIKTFNLPGNEWQMDATLTYASDMRIVVAVALGAKGLSLKIPIAVKDLNIEGRVRVTLSMASEPPLYKTMTVSFKSPPTISVGLQPLKAFDLDKVPMLGQFLRDTIVAAVGTSMVYPQRITIELGEPRPQGPGEQLNQLDADARAEAEVDPEAGMPMTSTRQKLLADQRKPEYIGRMRVIIKSAAGLRACDKSLLGSSSDPYCKVYCGAQRKTTPVIKKTLTPEWNTTMDFLVERAKKYQNLEIQVYDEDKVGKDEILGRAVIDFKDLVSSTDSEPTTATVKLVGKGSLDNSTITLSMAYIVD